MFGQQQQNRPFGGFGTSTPFGGTSTFGTSGGFGATTPAASTSLFGTNSNTTTPATGGLFGATSTGFSQNQPSTGFNFGQQNTQQSQAGTLFGTQSGGGSLFSTPTTNTGFGTKTPGGFGATTQSGGLFGTSNANNSSLFGTSSTTTSQSGGLFGGGAAAGFNAGQTAAGTVVKFAAPTGQDTMLKAGVSSSISTRHQCITAMKEYENKSLEELRTEDYLANRKGPQAGGTTTGTGIFGATSSTQQTQQTQPQAGGFGMFGQAQQTQNKSFGFGTSTATTGTTGGMFGSQPQSTGLFGASTQAKPLFGTSTTTTASTGGFTGFGQTGGTTSLFGQPNQQKPAGIFGTATTQSGGLFANPTPAASSFGGGFGFNNTQPQQATSLFGNKPAGFGTQTSTATTGFNFGQTNQTAGGLFGQKPATSTTGFNFGQTNAAAQPQQNLFGGNKPAGFGTLGGFNTNTSVGGLGTTTTGGLFGQQNKGFTGGFAVGGTNSAFNTGTAGLVGTAAAPTLTSVDTATNQLQQQLLAINHSPYGDSPLFRNLKQDEAKKEELTKPTNPAAQKAALNTSTQYKVNSRPTAKIKPKPLHSIANGKAQLFEGLEEEESSTFGKDTFQPRRSVKKLVIRNDGNRSLNRSQLSSNVSRAGSESGAEELVAPSPIIDTEKRNGSTEHESLASLRTSTEKKSSEPVPPCPDFSQQKKSPPPLDTTLTELNMRNRLRTALEESRFDSSGEQETFDNYSDTSSTSPAHPAGIVLRRSGYYSLPTLEELGEATDEEGNCYVENCVIGREGYGNVMFPGEINLANLNLDEIVHFRRKEITIYPDDDHKPAVGQGLNRRAQVTLDCVWPTDKTSHSPIKCLDRLKDMGYLEKLERASARIKAKFIDYRPETGSWVFEVKHFSKYGLVDSDDEDAAENETDPEKLKLLKEQQMKQLAAQRLKLKQAEQAKLKGSLNGLAGDSIMDSVDQSEERRRQMRLGQYENGDMLTGGEEGDDEGVEMVDKAGSRHTLQRPTTGSTAMMMQDDSDMQDIMTEKMPPSPLPMDSDLGGLVEPEVVPSSHRLARRLGVREEELQIRKASFFGGEDEEDEPEARHQFGGKASFSGLGRFGQSPVQSVLASPMSKQKKLFSPDRSMWGNTLKQPQQYSPSKPISPFRSAFVEPVKSGGRHSIPGVQEHTVIPTGMPDFDKPRKVVGTRMQRCIPALKESLLHERQRCISDMGLFQSRKFRAGWGSHWTMSHCGKPLLQQEDEDGADEKGSRFSLLPSTGGQSKRRLDASSFHLCVERIHTAPHMVFEHPHIQNLVLQCLETQLDHSELNLDGTCPLFIPQTGVAGLHAYATVLENHLKDSSSNPDADFLSQMSGVFDLCVALWGNVAELSIEEDSDKQSYQYHMARREAFSRWLHKVSKQKIEEAIGVVKAKGLPEVQAVYQHLTGRQVSEACLQAQEVGDHHLALLMAQAAGSQATRHMLQNQLNNWEQTQADQFIEPAYLKLYSLLAGHMVWPASHMTINTCDNLNWKRCLAVHLWYLCPPHATIGDALRHYNKAFMPETTPADDTVDMETGRGPYAAEPVPAYLEETGQVFSGSKTQDVCYHLLRLYSDRTHELHALLDPSTATPNSLDYRLSWHLCQVLRSLDYQHLSEYHFASVCCNYASQLESLGMWQWAVFVLLHLQNQNQREASVKDLLCRHVSLGKCEDSQSRENFICEKLQVPVQWLHQAKAMKARTENSPHEETWHLLKAEQWNESHRVLLTHVASDAIINEHFDYLKRILLELGSPEHCSSIQDWAIGGKVFLDYINMIQTIEQLKQGEPSGHELDRLQPEVTSLAKRISHLACPKARDRLCQSEMAKKVANVMKTLMAMQHPETDISARLYAPTIAQLPMPEDYILQELRQLTHSYMMEVVNS